VLAVLEEAMPILGPLAPDRSVARREIESPTADESALTPMLERLGDEFPGVWIETSPSGSRRRGARIVVILEAGGADAAEANEAVDAALKRLLALAAGCP
jgi:hypothetical protein